jgi:hypothetical protein
MPCLSKKRPSLLHFGVVCRTAPNKYYHTAIVNGEFLEIGEDGQRQSGGPGIAAQLETGAALLYWRRSEDALNNSTEFV